MKQICDYSITFLFTRFFIYSVKYLTLIIFFKFPIVKINFLLELIKKGNENVSNGKVMGYYFDR